MASMLVRDAPLGYCLAYLSHPVPVVDIHHNLDSCPYIQDARLHSKLDEQPNTIHLAYQYGTVTMRTTKTLTASASGGHGAAREDVDVELRWGITDRQKNGRRKEGTFHIYVEGRQSCQRYTETWQAERLQFLRWICEEVLQEVHIDPPSQDVINRRRTV